MRKITPNLFVVLLWSFVSLVFNGCSSENSVTPDPFENQPSIELKTLAISEITETSASISGNIVIKGGAKISDIGVCINTSPSPKIDGMKVNANIVTGDFECNFKDLNPDTKYYVRSYVSSSLGLVYGNELSFTTNKTVLATPKVNTENVASITSTSAVIATNYENLDKIMIKSAGVYLSTSPEPTSKNSITAIMLDENYNTKRYNVNLSNLTPNTKYYVKSYVETIFGVFEGAILSFTSKQAGIPDITTGGVTAINQLIAKIDARVLSNGGDPIIEYGFCWSNVTSTPTLETQYTDKFVKTEELKSDYFEARTTDLYPVGSYFYIRSFAKNKYGVGYGPVVKFKLN